MSGMALAAGASPYFAAAVSCFGNMPMSVAHSVKRSGQVPKGMPPRGTDAAAVAAVGVNVQFGGNLGVEIGVVKVDRLFGVKCVVHAGANAERRRSILRHMAQIEVAPAGVHQHDEIGPATFAIDWVRSVRLAVVEIQCDACRLLAAGGKAHHADFLRIDAPFLRMREPSAPSAAYRPAHRRPNRRA